MAFGAHRNLLASPQLMKFGRLLDFVRQYERGVTFRGYKYSSSLLWKNEGFQATLVELCVVDLVCCDYLSRLYSSFATMQGTRNFFLNSLGSPFH
jgi:hypothetical protein